MLETIMQLSANDMGCPGREYGKLPRNMGSAEVVPLSDRNTNALLPTCALVLQHPRPRLNMDTMYSGIMAQTPQGGRYDPPRLWSAA